jgi:hypothetical protein
MATQSFEIILQGIWDVPTVWPSTLVEGCKVFGMGPPYGHPTLLQIARCLG